MQCVSVPLADTSANEETHRFVAKQDAALIYLVRAETKGSRTRIPVFIDGKELAMTAPRTYVYLEVAPGKHTLSDVTDKERRLELDAKAGNIYFVSEEISTIDSSIHNQKVQSELVVVDDETGKSKVNHSRMIKIQAHDGHYGS